MHSQRDPGPSSVPRRGPASCDFHRGVCAVTKVIFWFLNVMLSTFKVIGQEYFCLKRCRRAVTLLVLSFG